MKQSPLSIAIVSVLVAVVLWAVATWLEDGSRWSVPEPTAGPGIGQVLVRPDTAVQLNAEAAACEDVEAALLARLDDAQYCSTDDDCTLFDYGYPIQCMTSVAKDEISGLRAAYGDYEQSCKYRVYYDCPTGQMQRQAVCRANRCAVELRDNEVLEEETRDYLGLEQRKAQ